MLRETEWMTLNHILLDIYMVHNLDMVTKKVMKGLRLLIPYSKGYFIVYDEAQKINWDSMCIVGFDENELKKYFRESYEEDYLRYLYDFTTKAPIYQDTNILMDNIRKFTPFYTNFLEPAGCPYGGGLLLIRNNRIIGLLELFRTNSVPDFDGKDVYILNILKAHIENIVFNGLQMGQKQVMDEHCFKNMKSRFELTEREEEILKLLSHGASTQEICEKLVISTSTVKKHTYNIYNKTGVKSRTQLLNLLYSM
ncbi:transcriptional regulator, LuxR family [Clostridiales bacterium 1_7_47FAA]|uniref:LuxR C-terminal-related transcriptional regulator n=1 Tax=Enterocloster hominis (ex Hitch et al. 2024) TaxID=1917870 RepID=A0ABV1D880_9FIRM|nr:LuxR C-terminal-related transcriptional regulator [Lachnoclostridium pacaense]EEQ59902.1 transcriptional regulator, LuxR family [Clostridiales bacterium 1_7_47FAA]